MRVSKQFYEVAGPLLYKKVVVKNRLSELMLGHDRLDRAPTKRSPAIFNLKTQLLQLVQHLTVVTHTCGMVEPYFPNVKTLLIMPYADDWANESLCQYSRSCRVLYNPLLEKVVIHNSRVNRRDGGPTAWPMSTPSFWISSPVLTIFLDETDVGVRMLPLSVEYSGVHWSHVKKLRLIVSKTPSSLNFIAQRESNSTTAASFDDPISRILVPVMTAVPVPATIYLFRDLSTRKDALEDITRNMEERITWIDQAQAQRAQISGQTAPRARPAYAIKTLPDYIDEGWEDEMIWQELKYWRGENARRVQVKDQRQEAWREAAQVTEAV
jgi:hypothetical protein